MSTRWTLSVLAKSFLEKRGMLGRVGEMLAKAAVTSHPSGNRRFHNLVFQVSGSHVESVMDVSAFDYSEPVVRHSSVGKETFVALEECEVCSGSGCTACGGGGLVRVVRTLR